MKNDIRHDTALAFAQLMPFIIQGAHLGAMRIKGITQAQFFLLVVLHTNPTNDMKSLSTKLGVRMPTLTGMVDRLVEAGFVRRVINDKDRRQVLVSLTLKGQQTLKRFQGVLRQRWEDVLLTLNDHEVKQFQAIVLKLMSQWGKS